MAVINQRLATMVIARKKLGRPGRRTEIIGK
jgi:hypothetical protein